jgi:hypothetical protein
MEYNTGALKDEIDTRDYQWSRVAGASLFDWEKGFDVEYELRKKIPNFKLVTKDQNSSFSCGGQAWAYYGEVLEALTTGTYEQRSAKGIYSQTFVPPAGGSNGRPNCDLCINQGWYLESDVPSYENGFPPSETFMRQVEDISTKARNNASYSKALVYANVNANIDLIANAVQANYGAVIGIEGADNGTWKSAFPLPPMKTEWAHWLFVSGAVKIDDKKYLKVKNSWGDTTGNQGWQYIGEDYFQAHKVWNAWTLVFNKANLIAKLKGERLSIMIQLLNLLKEQLTKLLK